MRARRDRSPAGRLIPVGYAGRDKGRQPGARRACFNPDSIAYPDEGEG